RRPWPIIAGIFVATLANHGLAGSVGAWLATLLSPEVLRWSVGILFIVFGLWTLKPDTLDEDEQPEARSSGAFVTTLVAFFLAEMGDKTQFATIALAARFDALAWVVVGTTLGMLAANVPAVLIGEKLAHKLPLDWIRRAAALVFVITGVLTLLPPGA
ncbi:MAG: TMEM165/GDT1 family protein, partial [Betaproteobacteria bacterium]|nr:TMEM165/GDT1 family protein [Betaproteobacteria bacterium]